MARIHEVFNRLVEQKHIVIKTGDLKSHDAIRIRLVKLFTRHKNMLEDLGADDGSCVLSVCATFDLASGRSTFHIKKKKAAEAARDWEIVEVGIPANA